jgi:multimeric flavodoxin WrbA
MNILILNGGPGSGQGDLCHDIRDSIATEARAGGWNVDAFDLAGMDIKPCRGCFACWLKHPGTCAIRDDEEPVLKSMAACDIVAWITPVTFGGYAPALKKALDRSIPNILPFFIRSHGEIHHPQRYKSPRGFLVFGTLPAADAEAERIFHDLVRRNAINLGAARTESRVFYDGAAGTAVAGQIEEILKSTETIG